MGGRASEWLQKRPLDNEENIEKVLKYEDVYVRSKQNMEGADRFEQVAISEKADMTEE